MCPLAGSVVYSLVTSLPHYLFSLGGSDRELGFYKELRKFVWIYLRRKQDTHVVPGVYWSIVHFLLGNALGDQISDAWFLPFLVSSQVQMGRV